MCMQNRNTIQPQSRLPSLRFTMRTYCRTLVEKERFDLSVRQVLRKSQSATLSTAYWMVFLFSMSLCQYKTWMMAVYAAKSIWHHMCAQAHSYACGGRLRYLHCTHPRGAFLCNRNEVFHYIKRRQNRYKRNWRPFPQKTFILFQYRLFSNLCFF